MISVEEAFARIVGTSFRGVWHYEAADAASFGAFFK